MKNRLRPCALAAMMLLLLGSRSVAARPIETPASPPPPIQAVSADTFDTFFLMPDPVNNAQGRSVTRVDPAGGVHVAFSAETSSDDGRPAYYGYCPSGCGNPANWTLLPIGQLGLFGEGTTLALDIQGRPRMMWYYKASLSADGTYRYAACNVGCTNPANWTVSGPIAAAFLGPWNVGYFALDGKGGAGFVYQDDAPHYVTCAANCTNATNWHDDLTDVVGVSLYDMRLAYTPAGQPRLLSHESNGSDDLLVFSACDAGCYDMDNWSGEALTELSYGHEFAFELDGLGRPRVALYNNDVLSYLWSNDDPLDSESWTSYNFNLPEGYGEHLGLTLDGADRPHLVVYVHDIGQSYYGLLYGACTADCESTTAAWTFEPVETVENIDAQVPPLSPCTISLWMETGLYPSVAVDAAGNPRISHGAEHWQGGPTCNVYTDISLIRFSTRSTGGPPIFVASHHAYLPLAIQE